MQPIKRRPPHHLRRLHYWSLGLVFGGQFFLIAVSFASICSGRCPECGTLDVFHLRVAASQRRHELAGGNIFRIDLPRSLRRRVKLVIILMVVSTLFLVVCAAMVIANPERQSWAAVSFGVASLICLAAGVLALLGWRSYLALRVRPFCESCGHSLVETDDATCAECGTPTDNSRSEIAIKHDLDP